MMKQTLRIGGSDGLFVVAATIMKWRESHAFQYYDCNWAHTTCFGGHILVPSHVPQFYIIIIVAQTTIAV